MKKIIVDKGEGIAEVIDRVLAEPDDEISLVIPKGSALGRSVSNFHLLKREADSAGRSVVVESVDETILAFAKESGIESSHPLWKGVRGTGGFSDIVPRGLEAGESSATAREAERRPAERPAAGKRSRKMPAVEKEEADDDIDEEDDREREEETKEREEERFFGESVETASRLGSLRKRFFDGAPEIVDDNDDEEDGGRRSFGPVGWWVAGIIVVAGVALYVLTAFFNHATIAINFKQTPWSYQGTFTADKNAVGIDPSSNTIPAQVFTFPKNMTATFTGSSVQQVAQKARGTITIYNDYSAKPQVLIATTRFETPDGKIFRITNSVTVPGETMGANGQLAPSSITAPIVADQAGPAYNIGPVPKLTIPGFASDPAREAGFYGAITASTTGGFIGKTAVPTAADIAAAKASTTAQLQSVLANGFQGTYPNNFKILPGATNIQVGTFIVNTSTDANGNYTVFGNATLTAIGFDESALKNYLLTLAQSQEASSTFKSITLNYSSVSADFAKGTVSFGLAVQAELEPALSAANFVTEIEGMSVGDARSTISALPELSDGTISLWPSWLGSIPRDPSKISITVN